MTPISLNFSTYSVNSFKLTCLSAQIQKNMRRFAHIKTWQVHIRRIKTLTQILLAARIKQNIKLELKNILYLSYFNQLIIIIMSIEEWLLSENLKAQITNYKHQAILNKWNLSLEKKDKQEEYRTIKSSSILG